MRYEEFIIRKSQLDSDAGFSSPVDHPFLFDFQASLTDWATRKGRSAIFADCGLGKTPIQLAWAENVLRHTNRPVLIVAPLAVGPQTVREGEKFGIEVRRSADGTISGPAIYVTNYERLHLFDSNDFAGSVCDESSAIKHFSGARQKAVTHFMTKMPYRLLCTATAAPNDFIELGTSSEALGQLGRMDMLSQFFKNDENSLHPIWWGARWRIKKHAEQEFWRWVCSWARAVRKPSDLGFDDGRFSLPPLNVRQHIIENSDPLPGMLFKLPAVTLDEQRAERRQTMAERCEKVRELCESHEDSVVWCHLNEEGDMLERLIPGSVQISGADPDERKEDVFLAFASGDIKVLITKPQIGAFGLNWQHCSHMTFFPSHSFEQYYQGVRRCWRFGQTRPVTVDVVTTEGEQGVLLNLQRKSQQAEEMFANLVQHMNNELAIQRKAEDAPIVEVPSWV